MAANFANLTRKLLLTLQVGTSAGGSAVTRTVTISRISETASADAINQAAAEFGKLLKYPVIKVTIRDVDEVLDN